MASSVCLCIYIIININNENVSLNCKNDFSKMQKKKTKYWSMFYKKIQF